MKRTAYVLIFIIFSIILISCSVIKQEFGGANELIKPGDKIGKMTVEQGSPNLPYPYIWFFCDSMPNELEPVASSSDCEVPQMSGMTVQLGWLAKESKFLSNWEAIAWGLSIDGAKVDLEAFEWQESDFIAHGEDNKVRQWLINLRNLSPGEHTLQLTQTMKMAVDDGFNVYQPGVYEHLVHFTVLKKTAYDPISSTAAAGQHPYTSKKAGLDILLYLPSEYGKDPSQEWPLILYLHGAPLRGATLELLMGEPLPKRLEEKKDLPFIVVSPLGDGEYEFWAKDKMIQPLFKLLDEIQKKYSIDSKRIYLTGNDMGGNGVWAIGLRRPAYFAALAPVAGYASYPFEVPKNICDLKDVPVWAFHGKRDDIVPVNVEQDLVDALNTCGGNARITVSPDMKNDVPYKIYTSPDLFDWLLTQSLE